MKKLGVFIDRFQTSHPTHGKLEFMKRLADKTDELLILIETTRSKFSKKDPLDYDTRKLMMKSIFPKAYILEVVEQKSPVVWSQEVDKLIATTLPFVGKKYSVVLLDSSEGSTAKYTGKHKIEILPFNEGEDDSEISHEFKRIAETPVDDIRFREGIIYATQNAYPKVHPTVDIAIFNEDYTKVLLGRKHMESLFRFIGGFADPTDLSYEFAAKRETSEEAGDIEVDDIEYIKSMRIDDWRYPTDNERIMTIFFAGKYVFGHCKGGDDIAEVEWRLISELEPSDLVNEHGKLIEALKEYAEKKIAAKILYAAMQIDISK